MSHFNQGIAYHIHYLRLDMETTQRVKAEAARIGEPVAEVLRRAIQVYFELLGDKAAPLPARQTSDVPSSLVPAAPVPPSEGADDDRFNLLGGDDDEH